MKTVKKNSRKTSCLFDFLYDIMNLFSEVI